MTDPEPAEPVVAIPALGLRIVVTVVSSAVAAPVLLMYAFMLAWFSPEITEPGWCRQESAGWRPDNGTLVWFVTCTAGVAGTLYFGLALARFHRGRRWWPWLVAAAAILAAGWPALLRLSAASWCPPPP
ncbi:hypothetical protein GCM10023176_12630 [Micromonospora coerulea]|uniref:Integral membrane protein n=1 Tax=Micromonospora coerulea TaxID=47856 RepID=A0ABP8SBJ0_9ACTN